MCAGVGFMRQSEIKGSWFLYSHIYFYVNNRYSDHFVEVAVVKRQQMAAPRLILKSQKRERLK
jgi:hypothetical protein